MRVAREPFAVLFFLQFHNGGNDPGRAMTLQDMKRIYQQGVLSSLDYHFAVFMTRLAGSEDADLFLAAALVSKYTGEGHVCLDLSALAGAELVGAEEGASGLSCPALDVWCKKLASVPVVGGPGSECPLILDDKSRLYLYRYWQYENELADFIRLRSGETVHTIDGALLREGLERYFPTREGAGTDWQKLAALTSVVKRFCVISGGPGTGKTTTVARVLALLLELEQAGGANMRIALTAPTGKAAARLQQAIENARNRLPWRAETAQAIPRDASTLHRLLGAVPGSPYFRHHAENPLPADVVIVDEASMVDLALMAKLVAALPPRARLILLGDKDQLASVEAGAVLGDICDSGNPHDFCGCRYGSAAGSGVTEACEELKSRKRAGIEDGIVELQDSFRFGKDSGIGAVSRAVKAGDGERALVLLKDGKRSDVDWLELPRSGALSQALRETIIKGFAGFFEAEAPEEMFAVFERFRILCALRRGPYGVIALNAMVEKILQEERFIGSGPWYLRRPVMITENDYNLKLFNGDIGIILPDTDTGAEYAQGGAGGIDAERSGAVRVFFRASDGSLKKFPPQRLPAHETVYAMTVHKSQGSEFDEVLLLLPDRESPVLTRELVYTGITRAMKRVTVYGRESLFRSAVSRRIRRNSGLRDAIWGVEP